MVETILRNNVLYTEHRLIKEICIPLRKINTPGFTFMRHFKNGYYVWLSNDLEWAGGYFIERSLHEKYSPSETYQLFISDGVDLWSLNPKNTIWQEGKDHFGFGNGISLYFKGKEFIDIFCFYTKKDNIEMNEFYINNISLLRKFASYFLEKAKPIIKQGIASPLLVPKHYNTEVLFQQSSNAKSIKEFLVTIDPTFHRIINSEKISERELECIQQCATGKSAKQVSNKLCLSPRTVESHLQNAKSKLGCSNLTELVAIILKYGSLLEIEKKDSYLL